MIASRRSDRATAPGAVLAWVVQLALAACGESQRPLAPRVTTAGGHPVSEWQTATPEQVAAAEEFQAPVGFENAERMRFVLVPAGAFQMGSPADEPGRGEDEAQHEVRLIQPYYVSTEVVTRDLTHEAAVAFAASLTARDPRWRYRLPTEAEWERALASGAVSRGAAPRWEWCLDRYGPLPDYFETNPPGPNVGEERVLRGGGARLHARRHALPTAGVPGAGVRLVATLSYGKAGVGPCEVTFTTVDPDVAASEGRERSGYEVRIISVLDRLTARQLGIVPLPWIVLKGITAPHLSIRLPPGRYYAQAEKTERGPGSRAGEVKFDCDRGPLAITLPIPKPGETLDEPQ